MAADLTGAYDVVSMHHYLEHTREPWDEIDAAHTVLQSGGHLLIEVPDPESRIGAKLGWAWGPWFQPQHQHFLTVDNLSCELLQRGFSIVDVERGPAHQPVDLAFGMFLLANKLGGAPDKPWLPPSTTAHKIRRGAVFGLMALPMLGALVLDKALAPLVRRPPRRRTPTACWPAGTDASHRRAGPADDRRPTLPSSVPPDLGRVVDGVRPIRQCGPARRAGAPRLPRRADSDPASGSPGRPVMRQRRLPDSAVLWARASCRPLGRRADSPAAQRLACLDRSPRSCGTDLSPRARARRAHAGDGAPSLSVGRPHIGGVDARTAATSVVGDGSAAVRVYQQPTRSAHGGARSCGFTAA